MANGNSQASDNILYFNQVMILLVSNLLEYKELQKTSKVIEEELQQILKSKNNALQPFENMDINSKLWDDELYNIVADNYSKYNNELFPEENFYEGSEEKIREFISSSRNNIQEFNNFDKLYVVMNILLSYCHNVRITINQLNNQLNTQKLMTEEEKNLEKDFSKQIHQYSENLLQQIKNNQKLQSDKLKNPKLI